MYYDNLYGTNNSKLSKKLFDVNKQIASGLKIQYASDDVSTFTQTMQLDNEMTTLGQVKKSTESGLKTSQQTDSVLNEIETSMDRVKVLLVQASSSTQSNASLDAVALELRGLEKHLKNLSNSSINGEYLFAGSATDVRPIDDNGVYQGNNTSLNAFLGSKVEQQYNLTGGDLFLGEEPLVKKQISSNVPQYNLSKKYPDFTDPTSVDRGTNLVLQPSDTIRDLMGDIDASTNTPTHFYISGAKSDGTSFSAQLSLRDSDKMSELLTQIGNTYGNTADLKLVNVSLNELGEIVIEDKLSGSSKIDFHMVAAVDFDDADGSDMANINDAFYGSNAGNIDNLATGETNFDKIIYGTSSADNGKLHVKSFMQSPYDVTVSAPELIRAEYTESAALTPTDLYDLTIDNGDGTTTPYVAQTAANLKLALDATLNFVVNIDSANGVISFDTTVQGLANGVSIGVDLTANVGNTGVIVTTNIVNSAVPTGSASLVYDKTQFTKDGSRLSSNVPQVLKQYNESTTPKTSLNKNEFVTNSTKISDVADLSQGTANTLDGTQLTISGQTTSGSAYTAQIDFKNTANGGSTFSIDNGVTNHRIFDMGTPRTAVNADDMTYQQLMDVVNMTVTGSVPPPPLVDTEAAYEAALETSNNSGSTFLSNDGKIQFKDSLNSDTKAKISIFDSNSGKFGVGNDASVITFNTNNALTIRDPKTDFFKELSTIIEAVENHKLHPDASSGDMRSVGTQNAITMISDLMEHVSRSHSIVGSQSNSLTSSLERTELLEISAMTLRSSIVDTDLAESSLLLTQLSLNYQAMLSTVGKVSQLSLVNYL